MTNLCNRFQPIILAILRISTAYMFLLHGSAKLLGIPHIAMFDNLQILSIYGLAGVLELVGGLLLILGLFTRPIAFILSGEMAFAYFMAHAKTTPLMPLLNGGEAAALFSFIFLYLVTAGSGAFALDNIRGKNQTNKSANQTQE